MLRRFAVIVALALPGCDAPPVAKEPPPAIAPRPPDRAADPPPSAPPVASTASAAPPAPAPPPPPRFGQMELAPTQGDLLPLLRDEGQRAKAKGLIPVVYFYADWCPPCRVFQQNMKAPEIVDALSGVYLVKLNMDDWHDKLKGTGFAPRTIPSFYFITGDGRPTGKLLDGDKWKKASPAQMGGAIKAFMATAPAPRP